MDSANPRWKVLHGNCLDVLKTLPDNSIDAVVSDPPYGLSEHTDIQTMVRYWFVGKEFVNKSAGFMGKDWDAFVPGPEIWREVKRVLKPGGYLLAFSGSRTMDLMGISIRFAGFDMVDTVMAWVYGSGFPKGLNVSKAIDKAAGAEREVIQKRDEARQWDGWNTALKPAFEPVLVAQKPFEGTIAENVLTHGTGAFNVDACRVAFQSDSDKASAFPGGKLTSHGSGSLAGPGAAQDAEREGFKAEQNAKGRWPPNVLLTHHPDCVEGGECHPECGTKLMDAQSGVQKSGIAVQRNGGGQKIGGNGIYAGSNGITRDDVGYGDSGGASRFFPQFYYNPKASRSERDAGLEHLPKANVHPTVKPIGVMRWLIKLVTPPGGVVLDPFNGSGTTGCAAMYEGCEYVGIEREAEYVEIAKARIAYAESQSEAKAKPALKAAQPEAVSLEGLPVPETPAPKATKTLDEAALKKLVAKTLKKRR